MTAAPPFGALAPEGRQDAIIRLTRRLPPGWLGTRASFLLRKIVLKRLEHPLDVEVYGQRMRLHPLDNTCEKRVLFTPQLYDAPERAALARAARSDMSFLDIGANVGIYSLFVAGLVGPGARVVAAEPDPEIFERLRFNIAASGLEDRIRTERLAVAGAPGRLAFAIDRKNRGQNRLAPDGEIEVEAVTLVDLMDRCGIDRADAMKIDIEGAEYDVFARFFDEAPPERWPGLIVIERIHGQRERDPVALARTKGYRPEVETKLNLVLKRPQDAAK